MSKQTKSIVALAIFIVVVLILPGLAKAGSLEPSAPPGATMHTLEDIYNKIDSISTLYKALVEKTGQTTSYATGDDGDLEKGVAWPNPRFTDNGNGTVTDNLTDLIWLKNANPCGPMNWYDAIAYCNSLASGTAGLTDGSVAGDWRLPNIKELQSLIDFGRYNPALPAGHPFTGVQSTGFYWSGTSSYDSVYAWRVAMYSGYVDNGLNKSSISHSVWPVRGGN